MVPPKQMSSKSELPNQDIPTKASPVDLASNLDDSLVKVEMKKVPTDEPVEMEEVLVDKPVVSLDD